MIEKLWKKIFNREVISYFIFGVLTTLTDWVVYAVLRNYDVDYRLATIGSWAAAVLFAFVTNKLFVFQSMRMQPQVILHEFISFVACRGLTGIFNLVAMIVMVDYAGINDFISKLFISVIVLLMNYVFSKIFIFKKAGKGR